MAKQQRVDPMRNWVTVTTAKIQEIGQDDKWHTIGECLDTPNAIFLELTDPKYLGHSVWIRDSWGDRKYWGKATNS